MKMDRDHLTIFGAPPQSHWFTNFDIGESGVEG